MAGELLTSILPRPYTGIVPYLSPSSFLTVTDFEKSSLASNSWLDLPTGDMHKKGRKRCDPDVVFRVFGDFSDHEPSEVRAAMLSYISEDFNYFRDMSWLNLNMHKKKLSQWLDAMRNHNTPADELATFALSRLYNRHGVIYTKNRTWCTIGTSKPLSEMDVYLSCDVRLVQMGPRNFVSLIKKPSSCMPVMQFERLENIYEGGYYNNTSVPSPPFKDKQLPDEKIPTSELETNNIYVDSPEDIMKEKVEYCALHGCKTSASDKIITDGDLDRLHTTGINFPTAIAVCKPSNESKLNDFNPLEESEPNLDLYMSNQNKDIGESTNESNSTMKKVITRKCVVKVRNLKQEEIDFLCGPKLLPSCRTVSNLLEVETPPRTEIIAPTKTAKETVVSTSEHGIIITPSNDIKDGVLLEPKQKLRPRRKAASAVTYPISITEETDGESTDEYTPNSAKTVTKPDSKRMPSASRIAAQKRKHKTPKPHSRPPKSLKSAAKKETQEPPKPNPTNQRKGNLHIKTVTLPKRIKLRSFKCPSCEHRAQSEKERNQHHKTVHGVLKCAVCEDTFDTPSGLHRHKYKHTNLNFICETCGDKFPFSSQLKDHRIKHLTGKGHTCFAKNCGKSFKNNSSLVRHLQTHSGKTFKCPKQGCDYSTQAERNLKSHLILHTDTHNYSCENCGQAFKYHTQMSRHVDNKVCYK